MRKVPSDGLSTWQFDESDPRHPRGVVVRATATTEVPDGPRDFVLCLSGGGYRAAAYHLGALRRLNELGLLAALTEIRSVSGGSVLAAWVASVLCREGEWPSADAWDRVVAAPFRALLKRDIRTLPIALSAPWNFLWKGPRLRLAEAAIGRALPALRDYRLPGSPRFVFASTDLMSGRLVELPPDGKASSDWPLARLALTSAAFPPFFGPRHIRLTADGAAAALVDGGVWGNLGVTTDLLSRSKVLLLSDASYPVVPLHFARRPRLWFSRSLRVALSRGDAVLRTQLWMNDGPACRVEVWRIDQTSNIGPAEFSGFEYSRALTERIAGVRTDFDRFSENEIMLLENHGYLRAASSLSWLLTRVAQDADGLEQGDSWPFRTLLEVSNRPYVIPPHPAALAEEDGLRCLIASERRLFRLGWLRGAQAALVTSKARSWLDRLG